MSLHAFCCWNLNSIILVAKNAICEVFYVDVDAQPDVDISVGGALSMGALQILRCRIFLLMGYYKISN